MNDIVFVPFQSRDNSLGTVPKIANCFLSAGAEVILIQLDDPVDGIPDGCTIIKDRGWKYELAMKHLGDRTDFRHLFLWDSDLDPLDFDPNEFSRCMIHNWLDAAHPTLSRDSFQDWQNGFTDSKNIENGFSGRYMSYLPVMALTLNVRAWSIIKELLGSYRGDLWSYGFAPLGNLGFIDTQVIKHMRQTGSNSDPAWWESINSKMTDAHFKHGVQHPCWGLEDHIAIGRFNR
jgi:hypothetical protein